MLFGNFIASKKETYIYLYHYLTGRLIRHLIDLMSIPEAVVSWIMPVLAVVGAVLVAYAITSVKKAAAAKKNPQAIS